MRVCVLFQSDFPPEPRLSRTAALLQRLGHEVELFCDNRRGRPSMELVEGVLIHRVRIPFARHTAWGRLLHLSVFWNPFWVVQFLRLVARRRFDVIHAINLTMAPLGWLAARLFGAAVVYDMYENYPAALRSWNLRGLFDRIFRSAAGAELLDRLCLRMADHVVVVTEEAEERARQLGARPDKITVVYNTTDLEAWTTQPLLPEVVQRYEPYFTIVYTGNVSPERGLETVVAAMPMLSARMPDARLVIAGGGPSEQTLRDLIAFHHVEHCVELTGWVDHKVFPSYIAAADVCVVPHPSNPFIDTTMPNKLFDYMAMGKPVVVSDAKPLARIVRECGCGAVFTSNSAESFVDAISQVRTRGPEAGRCGQQAVHRKYNWTFSSEALRGLYGKLALGTS